MINHIVMFRLKDFAESASKEDNAIKMKSMLEALPSKIKEIVGYEIYSNHKSGERAADLVLISKFASWGDLTKYINEPEHRLCLEFVEKVTADRWFLDFEN